MFSFGKYMQNRCDIDIKEQTENSIFNFEIEVFYWCSSSCNSLRSKMYGLCQCDMVLSQQLRVSTFLYNKQIRDLYCWDINGGLNFHHWRLQNIEIGESYKNCHQSTYLILK